MRHVRFRDPSGAVRNGEWDDDGIHFGGETFAENEVDVLAPVEPSKIVCVGRNYAEHAAEGGHDVPDRPLLFFKPPSAVASHGSTITLLPDKEQLDWEAELGVVVGEQCRNVAAEDAMDVVAGFTCVNDISNREDQRREQNWVRGKAFDGSGPIGPVVADPEHVPDDARITLRVNGETKQDSTRDHMIFSVEDLIEEITTYLTLEPGDVIATGTPEGVGPLSDGDSVEIEVEGVGVLEHDVRIP
jgi:2-keto-4-pentenoate hydratase/2-oxohepta-3-ene-1,7-dioic acid hydratase in catechol pathway